ncbi:right-handed parallel beta-helix repeat-containing protein [Chryseobacterium sp.]|uniref:right-handed parallel beta-helix repeat-containing protein n=1 Tax=Chryseobacterium sp. TaxID=1871047 RepID=UPI0025B894CC|nr:right-handed parallel beta-helix repeat-containing protein [Chryseobacterium sp.]MBV8326416.1 right-handed parallel beta-helix repeat-containing protein [Chryseobacterium sp.]
MKAGICSFIVLITCFFSYGNLTAALKKERAVAVTYYVSPDGNDSNSGTRAGTPWKTIAKINSLSFSPGDKILFKSGGIWNEMLVPKGSGADASPITIDKYGGEVLPVINGGGKTNNSSTLHLNKVSYWEIRNLEITNTAPAGTDYALTGIRVSGGTISEDGVRGITIKNCYVHDVNSATDGQTNYNKSSGGIILDGKIYGALVQNCHIANCAVEGLRTSGSREMQARSKDIIFDHNRIENIYGDGIVMSGVTGGCKIIYNKVDNVCMNTGLQNYAGIWTIGSINTLVAYNEVCGLKGGGKNDGMAFDADGYDEQSTTDGDIFEYNYSHDNNGGFFLFMKDAKNISVRYNVSVNDVGVLKARKLFLIQNSVNTSRYVHDNIFFIKNPADKLLWEGSGVEFKNNIFYTVSTINILSDKEITEKARFNNNVFYPESVFSSLNWGTSIQVGNRFYKKPDFKDVLLKSDCSFEKTFLPNIFYPHVQPQNIPSGYNRNCIPVQNKNNILK